MHGISGFLGYQRQFDSVENYGGRWAISGMKDKKMLKYQGHGKGQQSVHTEHHCR